MGEVVKSNGGELLKNAAPITFGLIIILGLFCILYSLLNHEYPLGNKDQIISLIETVKNAALIVVGYIFGSSASTKTKDETISDIAKSTPTPPAIPISIPDANNVSVKGETVSVTQKETP